MPRPPSPSEEGGGPKRPETGSPEKDKLLKRMRKVDPKQAERYRQERRVRTVRVRVWRDGGLGPWAERDRPISDGEEKMGMQGDFLQLLKEQGYQLGTYQRRFATDRN